MMSLVSTCIDEKKNISFIVAMQNAAVVIGFVLVAFLTFVAGRGADFRICARYLRVVLGARHRVGTEVQK